MSRPLPNIDGMPIARLRDMQVTPAEAENRDSLFNDIAYAIYITEVRAYRLAVLAGDHNDVEMTAEAIRDAIVRALKANCVKPEPRFFDNDSCGDR